MSQTTNARLLFNAVPKGYPIPGETTVADKAEKIDLENVELKKNEGFLVQLVAVSIDPYMRGKMAEGGSYSDAFVIGKPIDGFGVGRILRSESSKLKKGDIVYGNFPYQEYYIGGKEDKLRVLNNKAGLPLKSYTGSAGMPDSILRMEITHRAKSEKGKPIQVVAADQLKIDPQGDTIYISTAAGSVGSFLVQIAKRAGLKVIGSAGSDEKVAFLKSIGADVAFNYKTEDMRSILKKEGPINFYWDHVGGDTLDAALENMAPTGTVIVVGQIASYNNEPVPIKNFSMILWKRLTVHGFMVWGWEEKYADEFYRVVPGEIASGKIKIVEHDYHGLEEAGQSLLDVQKGDNRGKAIVVLSKE